MRMSKQKHTFLQRVGSSAAFLSCTMVVTRYHVPSLSLSVGAQMPLVPPTDIASSGNWLSRFKTFPAIAPVSYYFQLKFNPGSASAASKDHCSGLQRIFLEAKESRPGCIWNSPLTIDRAPSGRKLKTGGRNGMWRRYEDLKQGSALGDGYSQYMKSFGEGWLRLRTMGPTPVVARGQRARNW